MWNYAWWTCKTHQNLFWFSGSVCEWLYFKTTKVIYGQIFSVDRGQAVLKCPFSVLIASYIDGITSSARNTYRQVKVPLTVLFSHPYTGTLRFRFWHQHLGQITKGFALLVHSLSEGCIWSIDQTCLDIIFMVPVERFVISRYHSVQTVDSKEGFFLSSI